MAKGEMGSEQISRLKAKLSPDKYKDLCESFFSWDEELCAEHDGSIGSFKRLGYKIENITDFKVIFERDTINIYKVGKYVAGSLVTTGAVAASIVTFGGAPAIASALGSLGLLGAASTGTAISTLSGAALTSASLAAIGGSMAAGTVVITACGGALGGILGGVISNKYYAADSSFDITRLPESSTSNKKCHTIFINGFLQEEDVDFSDWSAELEKLNIHENLYGVTWSSSTNKEMGKLIATTGSWELLQGFAGRAAMRGGLKSASSAVSIGFVANVASTIIGNPWYVSMYRASNTGVLLADIISRTENQRFTLVGHSLGARAIYYALKALSSKSNKQYIDDVILLGGAVGNCSNDWEEVLPAVSGKIYNCYSKKDAVLKGPYQILSMGASKPIGFYPIESSHSKIVNIDCSEDVESHMKWKSNYSKIYQKIYPNPLKSMWAKIKKFFGSL